MTYYFVRPGKKMKIYKLWCLAKGFHSYVPFFETHKTRFFACF